MVDALKFPSAFSKFTRIHRIMVADVCDNPFIAFFVGENITRCMPSLPRFLRDNLHTCDFQPHGAPVTPAILHLKNDIFIQKLLKKFVFFEEPYYISNATDYKDEKDNPNIDLRVRPPTTRLFLDLLNDIGFLPERCVQKCEKDQDKN